MRIVWKLISAFLPLILFAANGIIISSCSVINDSGFRFNYDIRESVDHLLARNTVTAPVLSTPVPTETLTAAPTNTRVATVSTTPTLTATLTHTPVVTNTQIIVDLQQAVNSNSDRLELIQDVTIPDKTVIQPGELFIKSWRIKNTGENVWDKNTKLAIVEDDIFSTPQLTQAIFIQETDLIDFSISSWGTRKYTVLPGETTDLVAPLQAPVISGNYKVNFYLLNDQNERITPVFWVEFSIIGENDIANITPAGIDTTAVPTLTSTAPTKTMEPKPLNWSGIWTIRDPYYEKAMIPRSAWFFQKENKLTGFFYDNEGEPVLIQGNLSDKGRVFTGEFAKPWLNRATAVIWRMQTNRDQFYSVTDDGQVESGSICGGRNGKGFPMYCSLPSQD